MSSLRFISLLAAVAAAVPVENTSPAESGLDARGMAARLRFSSVPYGAQIKHCTGGGKKIALTFDDGPSEFTSIVLDTLEKAGNLKATFFLVGKNGQYGLSYANHQAVAQRMISSGHQVASHSFSHPDFDTLSRDAQAGELIKQEEAFANVFGFAPTYFRPPYTKCGGQCLATLNELAYHVTDYDLDTVDWEKNLEKSKTIFSSALNSSPGSSFITLAHDIHEGTANVLVPFMVETAKEHGYEFVTIGECLGDPAENWYRDPQTGKAFGGVKPPAPPPAPSTSSPPPAPSTTSTSSTSQTPTSTSVSSTSSTRTSSSSSVTKSDSTSARSPTSTTTRPPGLVAVPNPTTSSSSSTTPAPNAPGSAAGRSAVSGSLIASLASGVLAWLLLI